ncbi:CD302 antigen isoform X1 [Coregonus clupeaformis]|uniref:CD302 antigen isoform X1 n=1 Tax=Coregonus clupeaformis TaxID=59861 RepID=UPI001BE07236|nr:CD302 antigen isoform X1 [Coregonus clupeaformis]
MESLKKRNLRPLYLCNFLFVVVCWQSTLAGDCPADGRTWVPFGQRCYHFVHGEEDVAKSYTIEAAKTICSGYELLSVQSAEENNFIINYSPQVWKGNIHVWLGMYYDSDDEAFKWQDETGLSFKNWGNSSSESEFIPMDTCVAMHSSTGEWEKVSCVEDPENGVVCETAEKAEKDRKPATSPLLSALVILSVVGIMGISAVFWFLHQKHQYGTVLTSFEYHPPFRSPSSDEACLVETEDIDDMA